MSGASEVLGESIGSALKRYSKSLSIARCVESTALRSTDLKLSFRHRNSKVRHKRFVMGRGSAALRRVLTDNQLQRSKWTERGLLNTAQVMGAGTGLAKALSYGGKV